MKIAPWIAIAVIAPLFVPALHAATCEDILATGAFDCTFTQQTGQTFSGCMRFVASGEVGDFDIRSRIEFPSGTRNLLGGCSCRANGGVNTPKFDKAKTFDCLEPRHDGLLVSGKASTAKISKGQMMTPDGDSMVFTCRQSRKPVIGPGLPCLACTPAGQPCSAATGPCCEGLTCTGQIGAPNTCQ